MLLQFFPDLKKNLLPAVLDNLVCCRDLDLVINHFNQKDIAVSKVIIMIVQINFENFIIMKILAIK